MEPEKIIDVLAERFPGEVLGRGSQHGQAWVSLKRDRLVEICRFLKEDGDIKLDYLVDVTAVDWLPDTPRFEVVYHMYSMKHGGRLRVKVPLDEADASAPSVSGVWKTADWHERETYDMFGITFGGHPDHRRILMPDDWEGYPLRKDYPLEGPEWKFEPWDESGLEEK